MQTFFKLLGVALLMVTTNNFVWFALTYWAYLTTKSVISTSIMAGIFLVLTAFSGFWMGSIVDHHKKKNAMLGSSVASLVFFLFGFVVYNITPLTTFESVASARLWGFIVVLLFGTFAGNIYNIAIPTLIGLTVQEEKRSRANGMFGTTIGISFAITSIASGVSIAFGGMKLVLIIAILSTVLGILLLSAISIPEREIIHVESADKIPSKKKIDVRGTIQAVKAVPGLFALIFFATFNNFLGGVFFSLMDAYGLSLVSVQYWGTLWGFLSLSFIFGGLYISKMGLGNEPLRILFRNNIITWTVCIFFTIQPSIILLAIGTSIWMFFVPFIEAIEHTIFQKVVPHERLGRVFGFAQSVEQAVSPITAFFIGPITQNIFIPLMTNGAGARLIGSWFGTGPGRGIALVFTFAGTVGLLITLIAMRSKAYDLLSKRYRE